MNTKPLTCAPVPDSHHHHDSPKRNAELSKTAAQVAKAPSPPSPPSPPSRPPPSYGSPVTITYYSAPLLLQPHHIRMLRENVKRRDLLSHENVCKLEDYPLYERLCAWRQSTALTMLHDAMYIDEPGAPHDPMDIDEPGMPHDPMDIDGHMLYHPTEASRRENRARSKHFPERWAPVHLPVVENKPDPKPVEIVRERRPQKAATRKTRSGASRDRERDTAFLKEVSNVCEKQSNQRKPLAALPSARQESKNWVRGGGSGRAVTGAL